MLACLGAGISFFGVFQYFKGVLFNGTKPRMASWVAWFTANMVFSIVALQEGALLAVGINIAAALGNALIIGASMRRGVALKPSDSTDWWCLGASLVCVVVVVLLPDSRALTAVFAIAANVIATIPTLRHAWTLPHEETWQLFAANGLASLSGYVGVVLVSGLDIAVTAGPLVAIMGNVALASITIGRQYRVASIVTMEIEQLKVSVVPRQDIEEE